MRLRERVDRHSIPEHEQAGLHARCAEPVEFGGIEPRLTHTEQWIKRRLALQQADGGTVGLGAVEQRVGSSKPAAAGHVAHHNDRIAGQVPGEEACQRARERVIAAARARAHHDGHGLATIEVGDVVGVGGGGEREYGRDADACAVGWAKARNTYACDSRNADAAPCPPSWKPFVQAWWARRTTGFANMEGRCQRLCPPYGAEVCRQHSNYSS